MRKILLVCAWLGSIVAAAAQSNTWYVWQGSPANGPGTNWNTAFQDIQSAINAAIAGDTVLVTDGGYSIGSLVDSDTGISNRVLVNKAVTVESVNGPGATEIEGDAETRGVYLTNGASLFGFTLTGGHAIYYSGGKIYNGSGGAVYCPTTTVLVSNCIISGNGSGISGQGGGAYGGTLVNCTLYHNVGGDGGGAYGANLSNCVIVTNVANGQGGGVYQCTLNNCTVSKNQTEYDGAGAYLSVLTNCLVLGNVCYFDYEGYGEIGGGASYSTLYDCVLVSNYNLFGGGVAYCTAYSCLLQSNGVLPNVSYTGFGGGAYLSTLYNCVLGGNEGEYGGGAYGANLINCVVTGNYGLLNGGGCNAGSAVNCIIYDNRATTYNPGSSNFYASGFSASYCCTAPLPASGIGNILGPPGFVDETNGNYMLQSDSPCVNSGNNAYVTTSTDLAGNPRIVGGTVDIGAYEYQAPTSIISYAWLQQYGFPTDGSADFLDPDRDGMNNYQEWIAGTDPTNAASVLEMISVVPTNNPAGLWVTWQSVPTRTYNLQSGTNLGASPIFANIQTNIAGQSNATGFLDTTAIGPGPYYYRVGVSGFP